MLCYQKIWQKWILETLENIFQNDPLAHFHYKMRLGSKIHFILCGVPLFGKPPQNRHYLVPYFIRLIFWAYFWNHKKLNPYFIRGAKARLDRAHFESVILYLSAFGTRNWTYYFLRWPDVRCALVTDFLVCYSLVVEFLDFGP